MQIIKGRVNWNEGWNNGPHFELLIDAIPMDEELTYKKIPENGGVTYFAELDGYVHFFYSNSNRTGGCGGVCRLEDGTIEQVGGAWSSRAGAVNTLLPTAEHVVDAYVIDDPIAYQKGRFGAGAVTVKALMEAAARGVIDLGHRYIDRQYNGKEVIGTEFLIPEESELWLVAANSEAHPWDQQGDASQAGATSRGDVRYDPAISCREGGELYTKDCFDRRMKKVRDIKFYKNAVYIVSA